MENKVEEYGIIVTIYQSQTQGRYIKNTQTHIETKYTLTLNTSANIWRDGGEGEEGRDGGLERVEEVSFFMETSIISFKSFPTFHYIWGYREI